MRDPRTQIEIAHKARIHESKLSNIARGWRTATPDEQKRLAKVLGIPEEQLFPTEAVEARS